METNLEMNNETQREEIYPGQEIILCGYLGLEGMFTIWQETKEELVKHFSQSFLNSVEELRALQMPINCMTDCTALLKEREIHIAGSYPLGKGGIWAALWKLAEEAEVGLKVDLAQMLLKQETIEICEYYRLNPYRLTSTGCFLLVINEGDNLLKELESMGIKGSKIGHIIEEKKKRVKGKEETRFIGHRNPDELERWRLEKGVYEDVKCSTI